MSKANRQRVWIYGGILGGLLAGYFYQPVRIDLFPRPVPNPNPTVDPDSKKLFSKTAHVLVVTAHPDDAEYYLGPFLMRLGKAGAKIDLVVCTDGDKAFYPWGDVSKTRRTRQSEQSQAAAVWHANSVTFLDFPDGRLHPNPDVVARIREKISTLHPEWLVTFDGDYPPRVSHGDHRSAGQAATEAANVSGTKWLLLFASHAPNYTADVTDTQDAEHGLLAIHRSQFEGQKLEDVAGTVASQENEDGDRIGVTYGVSFRVVKQ